MAAHRARRPHPLTTRHRRRRAGLREFADQFLVSIATGALVAYSVVALALA